MNGGHDLGGMHGLGPINPEPESEEPVFHSEWEKRVFAMTLATGMLAKWNIDESRHARERQHPVDYLRNSYYENWLAGLETLLLESDLVTAEELANLQADPGYDSASNVRVPGPQDVPKILRKGGPASMDTDTEPTYGPGVPVRVVNHNPAGHTRAPRYARGHNGVVDAYRGFHVFPDKSAHNDHQGAHIYSVRFHAKTLWGDEAPDGEDILIDLWEPHLEPVAL